MIRRPHNPTDLMFTATILVLLLSFVLQLFDFKEVVFYLSILVALMFIALVATLLRG